MNPNEAIRRVSVVSTGNVQIRPDHVSSTWRPMFWWLLSSRQWTGPRPINAYVIEHRDGVVLFDTGQDRASVTDPDYFPGGVAKVQYDRLARFEIAPEETLSAGLGRLGYTAGDVHTAILSHLHQDHIGGLGEPAPTNDPDLSSCAGSHDLIGDGSLVLLPTPGHTPCSMSLLVRQAGHRPLLMVGDLTYDVHVLEEGHVPGVGSRRRLRQATSMVNKLRTRMPDLVILPAHDPGAADRLAHATGESPVTRAG
jgi:glyoxylase-like metal-dependent hydrolase (beta-lactamase superfamily II)